MRKTTKTKAKPKKTSGRKISKVRKDSSKPVKKNIILYIGKVPLGELTTFKKTAGKHYRFAFMYQKNLAFKNKEKSYREVFDFLFPCDFNSSRSIIETLKPYRHELLAATCRAESEVMDFAKVIPYIPYLRTPTSESLEWSINKIKMRARFKTFNQKITPKFHIVKDATKKARKEIEEKVGFPLVIKPAGLAQSLLVTICYHQEELEQSLKKVLRKIKSFHKEYKGSNGTGDEAKILVEQFMDGDMYSIDGHVTSRGKFYFYPPVHITTGKSIGFDDFFGYKQITPTNLSKSSIEQMKDATKDGIHALGLRSTTFHAELMKTEAGWKIIEIGPRIGGFRCDMYKLSYGANYTHNDILIRIPKKPSIKKKVLGHTAVMKFFARKEGTITTLTGTKKARELRSFSSMHINKKVGDRAIFAKNGGKSIFNIILFNKDRSKLLADIRRLEKMIKLETGR